MKLQQLMSYTRRAVDDYQLIEDDDHIAVGISGGKDSLSLLYSLSGLRRFYPHKFTLSAIMVNLGFDGMDLSEISELCQKLEVPFYEVKSEIGKIIFEDRKESNPCSLCAKMRKGALNVKAKELGCNKVAYAHHKDDVVETMLMSLIYEGRFHLPVQKIPARQTDIQNVNMQKIWFICWTGSILAQETEFFMLSFPVD